MNHSWGHIWRDTRDSNFSSTIIQGHPIVDSVWFVDPGSNQQSSRFCVARLAPSIVIECPIGASAELLVLPPGKVLNLSEPEVRRLGLNLKLATGSINQLDTLIDDFAQQLQIYEDVEWIALRPGPSRLINLLGPIDIHRDVALADIISGLIQNPTRSALRAAVQKCHYSARSLRRKIKTITGLSPDKIRRVQRIALVRRELKFSTHSLSTLAAMYGFSDQAHLTHEFIEFSGYTPAAWREHMQRWMPLPADRNSTCSS